MLSGDIFDNISPLDHRYRHTNPELFDRLSGYLSEDASVRSTVKVEAALLEVHARHFFPGEPALLKTIAEAAARVEPSQVYEEEERTRHNIRAVVHVFKQQLPQRLRPYVHLAATSVDILDTAVALRIKGVSRELLLPMLAGLLKRLCDLTEEYAELPQVGRTHGQFAVPVTLGFTFAEYVARLGKCLPKIEELSGELRGKLRGAVGAYNATALITEDPYEMERSFLAILGLKPAEFATQMVEPEYLLRLMQEYQIAFGIIANLADDLRNLQRSEIGEVQEHFSSTQVGSSTMPQKRNPWNSEHVKSLWKTFSPRIMTIYMDQISEHQRDLSNSASSRFLAEYLAGFAGAVDRMTRILETLKVHTPRVRENLERGGSALLAEPLYILLALSGESEGHEILRKLTLTSEEGGKSLSQLILEDPIAEILRKQLSLVSSMDLERFLEQPGGYTGRAAEVSRSMVDRYRPVAERFLG
ncbi:MAG: lyase family protein [Alkalispirochaetaceae bacterium]